MPTIETSSRLAFRSGGKSRIFEYLRARRRLHLLSFDSVGQFKNRRRTHAGIVIMQQASMNQPSKARGQHQTLLPTRYYCTPSTP